MFIKLNNYSSENRIKPIYLNVSNIVSVRKDSGATGSIVNMVDGVFHSVNESVEEVLNKINDVKGINNYEKIIEDLIYTLETVGNLLSLLNFDTSLNNHLEDDMIRLVDEIKVRVRKAKEIDKEN